MTSARNGAAQYVVRGPRGYLCLDDRGDVIWEPWALTTFASRDEANAVIAGYAASTRARLRIVEVAKP